MSEELPGLVIMWRISSGFSVIGSSCVCFLFFYCRWWNYSTHHVILFLISVSDIIYSTDLIVGPSVPTSSIWCPIQGWMAIVSSGASQIWSALLGLNLWLQMRYYWRDSECRKLMPWYHVIAWGWPIIVATIITSQTHMVQGGMGCTTPMDDEYWLMLFTGYISLWIIFLFNWVIITKIVVLLHRVMASIPDDMDNASNIKRHYKFVAYQTLMYIVAGIICWGIYLIWVICDKFGTPPRTFFFLFVLLNPLQGFVNMLVHLAPSWLHKCCFNKGNDEESISGEESNFANMDKDVQAVEILVTWVKTDEDDIEFDEVDDPSTIGSLVWNRFQMASERMSFFEGHGRHAIDIVRGALSESTPQSGRRRKVRAVGTFTQAPLPVEMSETDK